MEAEGLPTNEIGIFLHERLQLCLLHITVFLSDFSLDLLGSRLRLNKRPHHLHGGTLRNVFGEL